MDLAPEPNIINNYNNYNKMVQLHDQDIWIKFRLFEREKEETKHVLAKCKNTKCVYNSNAEAKPRDHAKSIGH